MSSSPFSPLNDVCIIDELPYQKSEDINGVLMNYKWCFKRNYLVQRGRQSCSTTLTRSGSIMSVGGSNSYSTGSYNIQSRNHISKYSSGSKAPNCVTVESGDLLSWEAWAYSNSNKLCFSKSHCPASTTPSASSKNDYRELLESLYVAIHF